MATNKYYEEAERICPHWWNHYSQNKKIYHNLDHIRAFNWTNCPSLEAAFAALFHDADYDPRGSDNEERACLALDKYPDIPNKERIKELIMSTKEHWKHFELTLDIIWLHYNDLEYFGENNNLDIYTTELKVFKEYQFIEFDLYRSNRIRILELYKHHRYCDSGRIDNIIRFLNNWKPNIGLYPGSFNNFHKGHLDILEKAEKLFDKVIIAQGHDRNKPKPSYNILDCETLKSRQVVQFDSDIFSFLRQISYRVNLTVIRGIRNGGDLTAEMAFQQMITEQTRMLSVNIFTNPLYNHVSSSIVRQLNDLNVHHNYNVE
jgi:pantetheine-phosphate adenylyltransferase